LIVFEALFFIFAISFDAAFSAPPPHAADAFFTISSLIDATILSLMPLLRYAGFYFFR